MSVRNQSCDSHMRHTERNKSSKEKKRKHVNRHVYIYVSTHIHKHPLQGGLKAHKALTRSCETDKTETPYSRVRTIIKDKNWNTNKKVHQPKCKTQKRDCGHTFSYKNSKAVNFSERSVRKFKEKKKLSGERELQETKR